MFALWPGDRLNFSIFKPTTFGLRGHYAASEAGHIANTNVTSKRRTTDTTPKDDLNSTDNFAVLRHKPIWTLPTLKPTQKVLKIFPTAHFKK